MGLIAGVQPGCVSGLRVDCKRGSHVKTKHLQRSTANAMRNPLTAAVLRCGCLVFGVFDVMCSSLFAFPRLCASVG